MWAGGGTACAAPPLRRVRGTNVLFGCESSRGLACVLVRCSLYPWASGSACRVDIEGVARGGGQLVFGYLIAVPPRQSARGCRLDFGSRLRFAGPTRQQGLHLRHNTAAFPRPRSQTQGRHWRSPSDWLYSNFSYFHQRPLQVYNSAYATDKEG